MKPVLDRMKSHRILAAFATVAHASDPVHAQGDDLVRLPRQSAQGHSTGDEAVADGEGILPGLFDTEISRQLRWKALPNRIRNLDPDKP